MAQDNGIPFQEGRAGTHHSSAVLSAQASWERRNDRQKEKRTAPGQASAHKPPSSELPVFLTLMGNRNIHLSYPAMRGWQGKCRKPFFPPKEADLVFQHPGLIKRPILLIQLQGKQLSSNSVHLRHETAKWKAPSPHTKIDRNTFLSKTSKNPQKLQANFWALWLFLLSLSTQHFGCCAFSPKKKNHSG